MKLAPVPVAGVPPGALQENVYGAVPPEPVAVNVRDAPTEPEAGPLTATARAVGAIVTVAVLNALAPLVSVTVALTTYVPLTL